MIRIMMRHLTPGNHDDALPAKKFKNAYSHKDAFAAAEMDEPAGCQGEKLRTPGVTAFSAGNLTGVSPPCSSLIKSRQLPSPTLRETVALSTTQRSKTCYSSLRGMAS